MGTLGFALIALGFLFYGLVSRRLAESPVTPTMAFLGFGVLLGPAGFGIARLDVDNAAIHMLAETTLVVVLFSDAARINLGRLRRDHNLPFRMLVWGMPLTIAAGTMAGLALLPGLAFWEVALLAAVLAPTDAALGQAVISNPRVPTRIRQALNVESGLNDGLALPLVLVLAACAAASHVPEDTARWVWFALLQLGLGPAVGIAVGYGGGRLIDRAVGRAWMSESFEGLGALGLAAAAYFGAELVHGNGFIAAFAAGLAFGHAAGHRCRFLYAFAEAEGQLLALATFLILGAVLVPPALARMDWAVLAYAALSLTLVRMGPVSLSLAGTGLRPSTHLFLGWFGPRGLASVLFALLILDRATIPHREDLLAIVMAVVVLSAVLHGMSAGPAARRYAAWSAGIGTCAEARSVGEMPMRTGHIRRKEA